MEKKNNTTVYVLFFIGAILAIIGYFCDAFTCVYEAEGFLWGSMKLYKGSISFVEFSEKFYKDITKVMQISLLLLLCLSIVCQIFQIIQTKIIINFNFSVCKVLLLILSLCDYVGMYFYTLSNYPDLKSLYPAVGGYLVLGGCILCLISCLYKQPIKTEK